MSEKEKDTKKNKKIQVSGVKSKKHIDLRPTEKSIQQEEFDPEVLRLVSERAKKKWVEGLPFDPDRWGELAVESFVKGGRARIIHKDLYELNEAFLILNEVIGQTKPKNAVQLLKMKQKLEVFHMKNRHMGAMVKAKTLQLRRDAQLKRNKLLQGVAKKGKK